MSKGISEDKGPFQNFSLNSKPSVANNGHLDPLTPRNMNNQFTNGKAPVPKRLDRQLVDFMKSSHVNQSLNLNTHRLNEQNKIQYGSNRRQMPTATSNDRIEQVRKSYDYSGHTSPRMANHIYSSAVEILKNNPKQNQYGSSQINLANSQTATSST